MKKSKILLLVRHHIFSACVSTIFDCFCWSTILKIFVDGEIFAHSVADSFSFSNDLLEYTVYKDDLSNFPAKICLQIQARLSFRFSGVPN